MDYYLNVFESKLNDLIKISINERYANGDGVLFLNFVSKEKLDVFYNPLFDKKNDCLNGIFSKKHMELIGEIRDLLSELNPNLKLKVNCLNNIKSLFGIKIRRGGAEDIIV